MGSRCTGPSLQRFPVRPVSQPRPSRGELGPAMADCGYRAPPAPRLARPPPLILPTPPPNGKLLSLRNLCKCGDMSPRILKRSELASIATPPTRGTQNAGEPKAHEGGKTGVQGAEPPGGGPWEVPPTKPKGGDLPTLATQPRVGPKTLANPKPTRAGKQGSRGLRPLAGGRGGCPPEF